MKSDPYSNLISKLNRIHEDLRVLDEPESQSAFRKGLDDIIASLIYLRTTVTNPSLEGKAAQIRQPLEEVIRFLECVKSDESLRTLISLSRRTQHAKPKRVPVDIKSNLTNEDIRSLLTKDLSQAELLAIAAQRAITVGKSNNAEIKRAILKNLERQEGYERLGSP